MIPREHGGWAMLLIPYTIGLGVSAGFGLAPVLFLACIVLVFMASKPLSVLAKAGRSKRKWETPTVAPAIRWLTIYLLVAGLVASPLILVHHRWWLIGFGALGAAFLGAQGIIESRKLSLTVMGELVGSLGLSLSAPGVYYVVTGHLELTALVLWLLTALHSAGSIFYINMRLRHRLAKGEREQLPGRLRLGRDTAAYLIALVAVLAGLGYLGQLPLLALVAFVPLACRAVIGIYEAKPEINFKRLGLAELANGLAFAALLVLAYFAG